MGFFQVAKLQIFYVLKLLGIISMWQENRACFNRILWSATLSDESWCPVQLWRFLTIPIAEGFFPNVLLCHHQKVERR